MAVAELEAPLKEGPQIKEYPLLTKLKARNLYLREALPAKAISEQTGISLPALYRMASKEGWTAIKKANRERLLKKQDARTGAMQEEVLEAIASASEQHAIKGLQRVGEALERTDRDAAKDFQALTAGVKNLATTARAMREPSGSDSAERAPLNLNLFFVGGLSAASPAPAKEVTEISAKTVS